MVARAANDGHVLTGLIRGLWKQRFWRGYARIGSAGNWDMLKRSNDDRPMNKKQASKDIPIACEFLDLQEC